MSNRSAAIRWRVRGAVLCAVCVLLPSAAPAQSPQPAPPAPDLEQRVRALEAALQRLQQERGRDQGAAAAPPESTAPPFPSADTTSTKGSDDGTSGEKSSPPGPSTGTGSGSSSSDPARGSGSGGRSPVAGWDEGFFLRSPDKTYELRITGQIQADYRTYLDGADSTDIDTFLLRRARLGIEANMFRYYEFRFLPDFGQGQTRIQDAYLNVHYWDAFQLEAGKFKQPFSYEQLIQDRFVPTVERSLIDQLVPARDIGLMVHGQKLFADRLDWAIAVANGEINGDSDTNDRKDVAARLAVRPFNSEAFGPALRGLQMGISWTIGVEQEPVNPNTLHTPSNIPWFQFNSTVQASGIRGRYSPELVYFNGPLGLTGQYYYEDQRLRPNTVGPSSGVFVNVPFEGFYVMGTLLLTGEVRTTYSEAIAPLHPFDPCAPLRCSGAWELVGRVSRLHVGDKVFAAGVANLADPTRYADTATEMTLGFNWYLNKWVRMQFNWEHSWFDQGVRLGPGPAGLLRHDDALLTRFQVIF
jgi:phosphate-selective porin OprO/OprP